MKTTTAMAALLCPLAAAAQAPWPQQPNDVMGIRLGAPLESAGIQPCSASAEEPGRVSTTTLCYQPLAAAPRPDRTFFAVHNAPDIGAGEQRVFLDVSYGRVAGVLVTGSTIRFDKVLTVLETRYGPAMQAAGATANGPVGTGASPPTKVWRGDRVTIEAINRFGRSDEFTVYWADLATQAQRDKQMTRESAGIASKL